MAVHTGGSSNSYLPTPAFILLIIPDGDACGGKLADLFLEGEGARWSLMNPSSIPAPFKQWDPIEVADLHGVNVNTNNMLIAE